MNRLALAAAALLLSASVTHAGDDPAPAAEPAMTQEAPSASPETTPSVKPEPTPEAKPEPKPEAKPEPKPEAKPEPKPEAKPEPKPEAKPEPKPEAKPEPKPEAKPEAKPEPKPLNACAAELVPVADSYQQAHDSLLAWLREASGKMDLVDAKIVELKKLIVEQEARITQLKLEAGAKNEARTKELEQQTRGLWAQLKAEDARRKDLCRALASTTGQKVRELNRAVLDQLDKSAAQTR